MIYSLENDPVSEHGVPSQNSLQMDLFVSAAAAPVTSPLDLPHTEDPTGPFMVFMAPGIWTQS